MIVDYASEKCDSEQILLWSWIISDSLMTGAQAKSKISTILRTIQRLIPSHIFPKWYLGALFLAISKSAHYPKITFSFIIWLENMDSPLIINVSIFSKNVQKCESHCQWNEMWMKMYDFSKIWKFNIFTICLLRPFCVSCFRHFHFFRKCKSYCQENENL